VSLLTEPLALFPAPAHVDFRPIHYLGSKARILAAIEQTIDEVSRDGPACDLFSGSGVVAARLARRRDVVSVDIQEYARVLASAQLRPAALAIEPFSARVRELANAIPIEALATHETACLDEAARGRPDALCDLLESDPLVNRHDSTMPRGPNTVLTRYYGGIYFSYTQAAALDGAREAARELPPAERDTALAAICGAASDAVASVGNHFAQPVRPRTRDGRVKIAAIRTVLRRRNIDVAALVEQRLRDYAALQRPTTDSRALRADYRDALDMLGETGVVYADPPYTRDHYSRFYHVLETIAVGDEPSVSHVTTGGQRRPSRGLYRIERHQSPFCIRSKAANAFVELFQRVRRLGCPLVLSYSPYSEGAHPRLMTVEEIEALAKEYFPSVEVRSAGRVRHSKLNTDRLRLMASDSAELLIVCRG
jgi:adenine-specific DNA-methyltransferase